MYESEHIPSVTALRYFWSIMQNFLCTQLSS